MAMTLHVFRVKVENETKESPAMMGADIRRLRELFPHNSVWETEPRMGNLYEVTVAPAKALYKVMVEYYVANDVSDEDYETSNFVEGAPVVSNLRSVFDDLLKFFEDSLGFTCSTKNKNAIAAKQQAQRDRDEEIFQQYQGEVTEFFGKLARLYLPTEDNIRHTLETKLAEYKRRLAEKLLPRYAAFQTSHRFRDATYKILVAEAVLNAEPEVGVNLLDLALAQLKEYRERFDCEEFWTACAVISYYLETPLDEVEIGEKSSVG